ncbi:hypothetical protein CDD80_4344 [Ophiocordyceps camponoti-rufipedis]|uniref:Glycosylphosphatidylinositol anchor biosynthesis protein 11 n=1 Tax=Ophiocordyceps camponoti-rufipedis TaxID=2004952 RepID=A0A2C5ZMK9_9HYPO|nr:hypothetical protein CDD80_4344 [Ophiocordyceps camponoti-rufipedis]
MVPQLSLIRPAATMPAADMQQGPSPMSGSKAAPRQKTSVEAVPILDTPLARTVSLARPVTLAGLLAGRFGALVADPVAALGSGLAVVVAVQVLYAVVCLPAAGSKATKRARPGERRKGSSAVGGPGGVSTALLSLALTAMATPVAFAMMVLFGAPLLNDVAKTMLCAAHLSVLGLFPIFYARGVDGEALVSVAGASAPLDETFGGLVGGVVGGWLGAVPIPLDWDRAWQRWPVTIVVGVPGSAAASGHRPSEATPSSLGDLTERHRSVDDSLESLVKLERSGSGGR